MFSVRPFTRAVAITPSDTVTQNYTAIYVGGTGDVTIETENAPGTAVTFKAMPVGSYLWVKTSKVKATLTTATLLIGLSE